MDDDDEKCFGDTLPSFEPCDDVQEQMCLKKIAEDKPLAPFFSEKYINQASRQWDKFYNRNEIKFFKDRHYLMREFDEFSENCGSAENPVSLFEVGCGVGNAFFPLMEKLPHLQVYAVDFSAHAIDCIKKQDRFDAARCHVWVCDVAREPIPADIPLVDYATMIFVLSAMPHDLMHVVVKKVYDSIKPGGYLFFRDYARYDMTQMRFKSGSKINDDLYVRWDGTLTAYLTRESAAQMFESAGFVVRENLYHRKSLLNRKTGVSMRRVWLQCRLYKPKDEQERASLSTPEALAAVHEHEMRKILDAEARFRAKSEAHAAERAATASDAINASDATAAAVSGQDSEEKANEIVSAASAAAVSS